MARRCGLSDSATGRRLARGDWDRPFPRVLHATDRADPPRERIRQAGLWAGDGGTVVGTAAAVWWRLHDEVPERIGVRRPAGASGRAPSGIALHRGHLDEEDRLRVDGIMTTKRDRTVLESSERCVAARLPGSGARFRRSQPGCPWAGVKSADGRRRPHRSPRTLDAAAGRR